MKDEALILIDLLESFDVGRNLQLQASSMIRRLVEELDRCKQSEKEGWRYSNELEAERKRLSEQGDAVAWVNDCFTFFTNEVYLMLDAELKEGMIPLYISPHHASDVKQTKPCNGFCGEQECKENQKNCERARMARKLLGSGTPQTKPLSDEEITEIAMRKEFWKGTHFPILNWHDFARAIEERHGIK